MHGFACSRLQRTVALTEVDVDSIDYVSKLRDKGGRLEQQVPPVHGALECSERAAVPAQGGGSGLAAPVDARPGHGARERLRRFPVLAGGGVRRLAGRWLVARPVRPLRR